MIINAKTIAGGFVGFLIMMLVLQGARLFNEGVQNPILGLGLAGLGLVSIAVLLWLGRRS